MIGPAVLSPDALAAAAARFAARGAEPLPLSIPDEAAGVWLAGNVPLFDCPDEGIADTFAFRWWTYRKHLRRTVDGWEIGRAHV